MIEIAEDKVTFSRKTWDDLQSDDYYNELIEAIIDREDLLQSIEETEYIVDFKEYDKKRRESMNV